MTGVYRILDEIALADTAFEAVGATPTELCEAAGRAVIELMADPSTVGTAWHHVIDRTADTLADLLFDWLCDLVYLKDAQGVLFRRAQVTVTGGEGTSPWHLHATLDGAPIDPATQELRADIKAVTKHLYQVSRHDGGWQARVVLDV